MTAFHKISFLRNLMHMGLMKLPWTQHKSSYLSNRCQRIKIGSGFSLFIDIYWTVSEGST